MIHYALRCGGGHEFDGWFKDSASFEKQDSSTVIFPVTIPAHGSQSITYTVHYSW